MTADEEQQIIADIEAAKPVVRRLVPGLSELVVEGGMTAMQLVVSMIPPEDQESTLARIHAWIRSGAKGALQVELDTEVAAEG